MKEMEICPNCGKPVFNVFDFFRNHEVPDYGYICKSQEVQERLKC